jgi:hypothetical protein
MLIIFNINIKDLAKITLGFLKEIILEHNLIYLMKVLIVKT